MKTAFVVYDFDYIETGDYSSYRAKTVLVVCKTIDAARKYVRRYNEQLKSEYLGERNIGEVELFE